MGLISEHEAASLAGVSVETIRQFTKFGLLRPEEGQYREVELRTVFRISGSAHTTPQNNSTETNAAKPLSQQIQVEGGSTPQQRITPEQTDTKSGDKAPLNTTSNTNEQQPEQTAQTTATQTATNSTTSTVNKSAPVQEGPHQSSAGLTTGLTPELTASYEFLELTRSLREQVEMLRVERDWLKTRLEKFEERAERDQMLLLSQGDSVSKLIQDRPQERSFLARMLPWFNRRLPA